MHRVDVFFHTFQTKNQNYIEGLLNSEVRDVLVFDGIAKSHGIYSVFATFASPRSQFACEKPCQITNHGVRKV